MSRKLMSMVLALALALTCLVGLSTTAVAEGTPTKITWYGVGAQNDFQPRINEALSKYLQSQGLNVELEIIRLSWSDVNQVYTTMMATQEPFDIINYGGINLMQYGINGGTIEFTDEMLDTYLPGVKAAATDTLLKSLTYYGDGKLYMVPVMHEWAQWYGWSLYNKDIVEAMNVDINEYNSLEKAEELFAQVHEQYPDDIVMYTPNLETVCLLWQVEPVNHDTSLAVGIDVMGENCQLFNYYESDAVKEMFQLCKKWNDLGYINNDPTVNTDSMRNEGKVFCQLGRFKPGSGAQYTTLNARYDNLAWDPEMPSLLTMKDAPGGWCHAIGANAHDKELAMQVLNLAYTDAEFLNLICFGEKDVDYTMDENGYVDFVEGQYGVATYNTSTWEFGNQPLNYVNRGYVNLGLENIWQMQEDFNNSAVAVESAGFFFDNSDVDIEVAAIANVVSEYGSTLWGGMAEDVDATLEEFNAKLYANGLQAVIDAAQEQYNAFLAWKNA